MTEKSTETQTEKFNNLYSIFDKLKQLFCSDSDINGSDSDSDSNSDSDRNIDINIDINIDQNIGRKTTAIAKTGNVYSLNKTVIVW